MGNLTTGGRLRPAGGQFSITAAYTHAPSREISVYDYAQVIFAAIVGYLVFGDVPDVLSFVGYAVICGMALWMFFYNRKADGTAPAKKVIKAKNLLFFTNYGIVRIVQNFMARAVSFNRGDNYEVSVLRLCREQSD